MTQFSQFGERFTQESGITELMKDLGEAIESKSPDLCMLGGGNPAWIPSSMEIFQKELLSLLQKQRLQSHLAYYSTPRGDQQFLDCLASYFNQHYGWGISSEHIALTNGGQNSFFFLFNILAGKMSNGSHKKILFPLSPEYIGYRDMGLSEAMFSSQKPIIQELDAQLFKYHVDFEQLKIDETVAGICVSRPTNPTGNVITDDELERLDILAQKNNIPLMIDNAYGLPFPGAIYTKASLHWHDNIILSMSLSKLGLPGLRTGIIIAKPEITEAIVKLNGITCLAPNNMGASIMTALIENKQIEVLTEQCIRPFYLEKMEKALSLAKEIFSDLPVRIHKPEGAFFLWVWFKDLPISTKELYKRLKEKQVYIIPGEDFFMGIDSDWPHQYECIRINYAFSETQLEKGLKLIANEVTLLLNK